jgi:hypothetical protein
MFKLRNFYKNDMTRNDRIHTPANQKRLREIEALLDNDIKQKEYLTKFKAAQLGM